MRSPTLGIIDVHKPINSEKGTAYYYVQFFFFEY